MDPDTAKVVVVALVVVALDAVKFWRVDEPLRRRFARVPVCPEKFCKVEEPETKKLVE